MAVAIGPTFTKRLRRTLTVWWYRVRHGIDMRDPFGNGTVIPAVGPGRFVSVFVRGSVIDVVNHTTAPYPAGTIRLVPCQYNHGLAVELIDPAGQMLWRTHLDYGHLYQHGAGAGEMSRPAAG